MGGANSGGVAGSVRAAGGAARLGGSLTGNTDLSAAGSLAGNVLGIYSGLQRGGVAGYLGAGLSGAAGANTISNLTGNGPLFSSNVGSALGAAGDVLGIYNGIKQGGLAGYGSAALNAYQLYNTVSPFLSGGSAAAGAGAGLGGAAAASGAGAIAALPVIAGSRSSGVVLNSDYWNRFSDQIKSVQASSGSTDPQAQFQKTALDNQIIGMLTEPGPSMSGSWHLPPDVLQYAQENGLFQAAQDWSQIQGGGGPNPYRVTKTQV